MLDRTRHAIAYAKGTETIEDLLAAAGAADTALALEEHAVIAATRAEANRLANADRRKSHPHQSRRTAPARGDRALRDTGALAHLPHGWTRSRAFDFATRASPCASWQRSATPDDESVGSPPAEQARRARGDAGFTPASTATNACSPSGRGRRLRRPGAVAVCGERAGRRGWSEDDLPLRSTALRTGDRRGLNPPPDEHGPAGSKTTKKQSDSIPELQVGNHPWREPCPGRYGCPRVLAAYADLKERLAEIHDLQKTRSLLAWDQQVLMPAGGSGVRAEQIATLDRIAHTAFTDDEIGRLLDQLAPFEESQPLRLGRGQPDPRHPARLGEGPPRPVRPPRRDVPRLVARAAGVGRGARELRFRALPAAAATEPRAPAAVRRLLRRLRRALRRAARRLRARDDHGRGPRRLRPAEGASRCRSSPRRQRDGEPPPPRPSVPPRGAEAVRVARCSSASASIAAPGGSIRPCTRSRARSARTTSG